MVMPAASTNWTAQRVRALPDDRPEIIVRELAWQPDSAVPALTIDLDGYFREVCLE